MLALTRAADRNVKVRIYIDGNSLPSASPRKYFVTWQRKSPAEAGPHSFIVFVTVGIDNSFLVIFSRYVSGGLSGRSRPEKINMPGFWSGLWFNGCLVGSNLKTYRV